MDIQELEKIEQALRKREMTYEEASAKIYSSTTKPWQTAEWKKKRKESFSLKIVVNNVATIRDQWCYNICGIHLRIKNM